MDCGKLNDCAIILPKEENKWLSFSNHSRKERLPFAVYADLECVLEKKQGQEDQATYAYQHHKAFSIGYYVSCSYDNSLSYYKSHRGDDCIAWFVAELDDLARRVKTILTTVLMADLTREETDNFHSAANCHVCEKPFGLEDTRVRDHCHLTGRYRGPAHSSCNLNYKDSHVIPVIFHNLSGYDAHFIH